MDKEKLETVKDLNLILKHLDKIGSKYICFSDVFTDTGGKGFVCMGNLDLCQVLNVFMVFIVYIKNQLEIDKCDCTDCTHSREILKKLIKNL